jgi:hypothetical protein
MSEVTRSYSTYRIHILLLVVRSTQIATIDS